MWLKGDEREELPSEREFTEPGRSDAANAGNILHFDFSVIAPHPTTYIFIAFHFFIILSAAPYHDPPEM